MIATIHPASKSDAAAFLSLPVATINSTARAAVQMALDGGYDGVQIDFEGLQPPSGPGFLSFIAACAVAVANKKGGLSVTVYAPKLLFKDFGP